MLSRFSVKHPYIVVVAVIVCLILGGVSLSKMKTDLLPEMDIPYLAVIATDPGASAEKVQTELTEPLESALSTVSGVAGITSQSAGNYAMVFLEFEDGTNMDSALVKVSSALNEVQAVLPETAGAPNIVEISMDMMANSYISATHDGKNIYELSAMATDDLAPRLQRLDGVADVSVTGAVEQTVEVRLSESKIEDVNNRILASVNSELEDAKRDIDEGEEKLAEAEAEIKAQQEELEGTQQETTDQLGQAVSGLTLAVSSSTSKVTALGAQLQALQAQGEALGAALEAAGQRAAEAQAKLEGAQSMEEAAAAQAELAAIAEEAQTIQDQLAEVQRQAEELAPQLQQASDELTTYQGQLAEAEAGSIAAASGFGSGQAQLASALATIESNKESLAQAREQYEDAREQAIEQANVDALVDKNTLAQLIKAQDFSMPAGYLGNADEDNQWLLHVGDNITSVDQLESLLLLSLDDVGDIRLSDVADITVVDNAGSSFMKVDGQEGVLLSVFKASTASTNEVSSAVNRALPSIMEEFPGLNLRVVSDQGSYIDLFISSLLQSLLLGALLAVVVLALFLRDWKPTVLVAVSIPFSVLLALLVM